MPTNLELLTKINLDNLVSSFGWDDRSFFARILRRLFHKPAEIFAQQMLAFDFAIEAYGLTETSRRTERRYVRDVRVFGADLIPDLAFLALSNHLGITTHWRYFARSIARS